MSNKELVLPRLIVVRAGATCLDLQGRVTGNLDLPLAAEGEYQAEKLSLELGGLAISGVVMAPGLAAAATARPIASRFRLRSLVVQGLANIDFGLWHGRCFEDLQQTQPRLLKCLEENPDAVCPPQGEPLVEARGRVTEALGEVSARYHEKLVAAIVSGPVAALIRIIYLGASDLDEVGFALCTDPLSDFRWMRLPEDPRREDQSLSAHMVTTSAR